MKHTVECFIRGNGSEWEAFCADFDISVHASSLSEAKTMIERAVISYVEDAIAEGPVMADKLLNRRAPLLTRIGWRASFMLHTLGLFGHGADVEARLNVPCPA
jgi:hypothetical protein